jgi:hypothetical protein
VGGGVGWGGSGAAHERAQHGPLGLSPHTPSSHFLTHRIPARTHAIRRNEEREAASGKSSAELERAAADGDAPLLAGAASTPRRRTGKVIGGGAADEEENSNNNDVRVVRNVLADTKGASGDKECV